MVGLYAHQSEIASISVITKAQNNVTPAAHLHRGQARRSGCRSKRRSPGVASADQDHVKGSAQSRADACADAAVADCHLVPGRGNRQYQYQAPGPRTDRPNAAKPAFAVMQHRHQCRRIKIGIDPDDSVLEPRLIGNRHWRCFVPG